MPTVGESALPGYDVTTWYGIFVSRRVDAANVSQLAEVIAQTVAQPAMQTSIAHQGMQASSNSPQTFRALVDRDIERWGKFVRSLGLRVD